jgi:hypothetical protein
VVRGVPWEFGGVGGGTVVEDFYVLEDLPVDVVFSSDFVFQHDVFGDGHDEGLSLREYEELMDVLRLCNIRLIGRFRKGADQLPEDDLGDGEFRQRKLGDYQALTWFTSDVPGRLQPLDGSAGACPA